MAFGRLEDIRALLSAGCDKVSINSSAVKDPDLIREAALRFGSQCIVVNIDPKRVQKEGKEFWEVHVNGGRVPTGLEAIEWAQEVEDLGAAGEIVLTSMDADGTKDGYDLPITKAVAEAVTIPVVASGGAGCPEHLHEVLTEGKASAALAASIFHYGTHPVEETKQYLAERGIPIRFKSTVSLSRKGKPLTRIRVESPVYAKKSHKFLPLTQQKDLACSSRVPKIAV